MKSLLILSALLAGTLAPAQTAQQTYYSPEYRAKFKPEDVRSEIDKAVRRAKEQEPERVALINRMKPADPSRSKILELRKEIMLRLIAFIGKNAASDDADGPFYARQGALELNQLCDCFQEEKKRFPIMSAKPIELNLREFGSKGDGRADDAPAFRAAIAGIHELRKTTDTLIRLRIPKGKYRLATKTAANSGHNTRDTLRPNAPEIKNGDPGWQRGNLVLLNLDNVILEAEPGTMLLPVSRSAVTIAGCRNIVLKNLTVDYSELPFTQGDITATDGKQALTVRIDKGFPTADESRFVNSHENLGMIVRNRDFITGKDVFFSRKTERNADGTFRVLLEATPNNPAPASMAAPGDKLIITARSGSAVSLFLSSYCDLINLNIHSAPGCGVSGWECSALTFQNLKVVPLPGSGRLISSSADASQTASNIIGPAYLNCEFAHAMDDILNVTTRKKDIIAVRNDGKEMLQNGILRPGHRIQLVDPQNGSVRAEASVKAFALGTKWNGKATGHFAAFDSAFPEVTTQEMLGQKTLSHQEEYAYYTGRKRRSTRPDWLLDTNISGSGTVIYRCTASQIRGSMRIQCSNALIAENRCENVKSAVGISLLPAWGEIVPVHNIIVRNNSFIRDNHGIAVHGAGKLRPIRGLDFISNRIEEPRIAAAHFGEVSDVLLRNNSFQSSVLGFGISLDNADNIRFENNSLNFPKAPAAKLYHRSAKTGKITVDGNVLRD